MVPGSAQDATADIQCAGSAYASIIDERFARRLPVGTAKAENAPRYLHRTGIAEWYVEEGGATPGANKGTQVVEGMT